MQFTLKKGNSEISFTFFGPNVQIAEFKNNSVVFVDAISREDARKLFSSYVEKNYKYQQIGKSIVYTKGLNGIRYVSTIQDKEIISSPYIEQAMIFDKNEEARKFIEKNESLKACAFVRNL